MRLTIGLIVSLLIATVGWHVMAQELPRTDRKDSLRNALQSWDKSDSATSDRYIAAFRDLSGDGNEEAVVYLMGPDWCGTGGCVTLVLVRKEASWKVISDNSVTRLPIRVLATTSHGWHSIGVWIEGGGVHPGHEVELRFNGKTYPKSLFLPPELKANDIAGDILISNDEKVAKPLY